MDSIYHTTVLALPLASQLRVQRERTSAKVNTGKRELPHSKLCLATKSAVLPLTLGV